MTRRVPHRSSFADRPTRRLRTAMLACAGALALLAVPASHAQSLSELLESARAHDARFLAARADAEATLRRADQARALVLPSVGLSGGLTGGHSNFAGGPNDSRVSHSVGVSASHPLFNRANQVGAEQGLKQAEFAGVGLAAAEQDLILRVAQGYFDVLIAQDTLTSIQARKAAITEQLASAQRNFEVGTATITDAREAQAQFDLTVAQEIAAENDLRVKGLALQQLVGRDNVEPRRLTPSVDLPGLTPEDLGVWVMQAEQGHPAIQQARIFFELADMEVERARAGHLPTVNVVAGVQRGDTGGGVQAGGGSRTDASIGLQLNMPLFAGYAIENRVRETVALRERARNDLDDAVRTVTQATRQAYFGVTSGRSQVRALEAAESSSQLALEATQLGYEVGVRVNLDVLNAQTQLFQTQSDLARARYEVLLGTLRLLQASGQLDAQDVATISRLLAR